MRRATSILSCLLLGSLAGCSMDFEGTGRASMPSIDDSNTPGRSEGVGSALIFGADPDREPGEARLAGQSAGPSNDEDRTPPATR